MWKAYFSCSIYHNFRACRIQKNIFNTLRSNLLIPVGLLNFSKKSFTLINEFLELVAWNSYYKISNLLSTDFGKTKGQVSRNESGAFRQSLFKKIQNSSLRAPITKSCSKIEYNCVYSTSITQSPCHFWFWRNEGRENWFNQRLNSIVSKRLLKPTEVMPITKIRGLIE